MGKSMVFESLDEVFSVGGKPQQGSSFPLSDIIDVDVLLWQEFKWSPKVCSWEDLLSILCGEKLGIRMPGTKGVQHRNCAPMFYTARQSLKMISQDVSEMEEYNEAMTERFKIRTWSKPLPKAERRPDFPKCGCCFATAMIP